MEKEFGATPYWEERWGKERTINLEMTGNWDDIDRLTALLKHWQGCGNVGHSCGVRVSMDGDGTSRPKIKINGEKIYDIPNKFMKVTSNDKFDTHIDGWDKITDEDIEKLNKFAVSEVSA